jgi:hypothetical protein
MLPITLTKNSRILVHRKRVLTFFCPNANFKTHFLTGPKSGSALGASILFWCCNGATDFFNMYLSWWYCSHHVLIRWWCIGVALVRASILWIIPSSFQSLARNMRVYDLIIPPTRSLWKSICHNWNVTVGFTKPWTGQVMWRPRFLISPNCRSNSLTGVSLGHLLGNLTNTHSLAS